MDETKKPADVPASEKVALAKIILDAYEAALPAILAVAQAASEEAVARAQQAGIMTALRDGAAERLAAAALEADAEAGAAPS